MRWYFLSLGKTFRLTINTSTKRQSKIVHRTWLQPHYCNVYQKLTVLKLLRICNDIRVQITSNYRRWFNVKRITPWNAITANIQFNTINTLIDQLFKKIQIKTIHEMTDIYITGNASWANDRWLTLHYITLQASAVKAKKSLARKCWLHSQHCILTVQFHELRTEQHLATAAGPWTNWNYHYQLIWAESYI